jgi:Tol biopolymer transport system component
LKVRNRARGSRITFEGWDDSNPSRDGVYTGSATNASGLVQVTTNPFGGHDTPGDYSPDGTQIAFWRNDPALANNRGNGGRFALFVVGVNGGAVRQLTGWQRDFGGVSWSPDGQWLLTDNAQGGLYVIHPDGTGRQPIPIQAGGSRVFARVPSWSPNGKKIIFTLFTAATGQEAIYTAQRRRQQPAEHRH